VAIVTATSAEVEDFNFLMKTRIDLDAIRWERSWKKGKVEYIDLEQCW